MSETQTEWLGLRVDEDLLHDLREIAKTEERSLSNLVRFALRRFVETYGEEEQ